MMRLRSVVSSSALLAMALLASACSVIDRGGTYEVVAEFPRAVSLYESGAVQVLGLPAGEVTDITVVGDRVRVTMAVDEDIPLPADVKAALVPQSLIGERRIQLFPTYREGDPMAEDGHLIAMDDTVIPVEPDEALAALKEFLDSLDPNGVGRLIDNAATAVDGQGANLGSALGQLSELVGNVEDSGDEIVRIAERFDDFTATLLTREAQLGQVLDDFSVVAGVLADERDDIETLVTSLAGLSENGLDLVSEHAVRLRTDVDIVTRLVSSVAANLDAVGDTLAGGEGLVTGFGNAFDPGSRSFNLRTSFGPLVQQALQPIFDAVGVPFPCIPVDTACAASAGVVGQSSGSAVDPALARPTSPIDDVLGLLGSTTAAEVAPVRSSGPERSLVARAVSTLLGVGS